MDYVDTPAPMPFDIIPTETFVEVIGSLSIRDILSLRLVCSSLIPVGTRALKKKYCTVECEVAFPDIANVPFKVGKIIDGVPGFTPGRFRRYDDISYCTFDHGYTMVVTNVSQYPDYVMFVVKDDRCSLVVETRGDKAAHVGVYKFSESIGIIDAIHSYLTYGVRENGKYLDLFGIASAPSTATTVSRIMLSMPNNYIGSIMYSESFSESMLDLD